MEGIPHSNNQPGELIFPSENPQDVARRTRISTFNNLVGLELRQQTGYDEPVAKLIALEVSGLEPTWELVSELTGLAVEKLQEIAAGITGFELEELNTTNTEEFRRLQSFCRERGLEQH
ncbi:MAG: hypothetical protein WCK98_05345 [bacterium]